MPFLLFSPSSLNILPYCFLGLLVMAEGPVATLLGGAATSSGTLLPIPVFISVVTGNLLADLGWYGLGRFGKSEWLDWAGSKLGVDLKKIEELRTRIQQYAPRLLFLSKLTVGFPIPTLVATGLSRVPVRRWAAMWILGELLKSAALVTIGYLFARTIQQASQTVKIILGAITGGLLLGFLIWSAWRKKKAKKG